MYGPISSDAANNDACSASICYTHGADRYDLYFCKSSVDDNMPRTPGHHSLLHLIVHTDFMTDIPWEQQHRHMVHCAAYSISSVAFRCA